MVRPERRDLADRMGEVLTMDEEQLRRAAETDEVAHMLLKELEEKKRERAEGGAVSSAAERPVCIRKVGSPNLPQSTHSLLRSSG